MKIRRVLLTAAITFLTQVCNAQIQNRLKVNDDIHVRYAYGRMQPYSLDNLRLSDSIYYIGETHNDIRLKSLALTLEMPVRYYNREFDRMDSIAAELRRLIGGRQAIEVNEFYYSAIFDYCQFLISTDRATDAMLQARDLQRRAQERGSDMGRMFATKTIGLIQSYRSNSALAIQNFQKAAEYCIRSKNEQELPNLYILIAQEMIKTGNHEEAMHYCTLAEEYQDFFPSLRVNTAITKAYIYKSQGNTEGFLDCYRSIINDPFYLTQVGSEKRNELDINYLRTIRLFNEALALADSMDTSKDRHRQKYEIYAESGEYINAYNQLKSLMAVKDSIYIAVQNEDMAILDAEMNNAQLRAHAEKLKAQNQMTVVICVLIMLMVALFAIILSAWNLDQNLNELKKKNREFHTTREAYQRELRTKELENEMKIKIIQNRPNNRYDL